MPNKSLHLAGGAGAPLAGNLGPLCRLAAQRAWIALRDAEAAFAADQFRGGSAAPVLRSTSMAETTEQRIKQLKADFSMAE